MNVLIASAAVLTAILVGMALYIKSHPPEASAKGVFWLQRGLRLGAAFQSNRKLGYIDKKGEVIVPPSLDWGTEFVDGVAAVSDSSGYRVVDTAGRTVCRLDRK